MDFEIPEELQMVQTTARDFVSKELIPLEREILGREPTDARVTLSEEEQERLIRMAKEIGFWSLNVPEELGGLGLPVLGLCLVEEELAKTIVPFQFGDVSPLLFDCNEEQTKRYLLPVIEGQKRGAIALLEPTAAHPMEMKTVAIKENGHYIINGQKLITSVSDPGDFFMVFAITNKEQETGPEMTCFLVDIDTPGVTVIGDREERKGWRAQATEPITLVFGQCSVPEANILGQEGAAYRLGAKWLPSRRVIRSARAVGAMERLLEVSAEYAKNWQSFGQPITERLNVQQVLADMATNIQATRLMVYYAASKADEGQDIRRDAAMVKVFASGMVQRAADQAAQLHGGPAYARDLPIERLCHNALSANAADQALELQRAIIAREILRR